MALVKCTHCKFIREVGNQHEGKRVKCPKCQTLLYVQDTITLVNDLSEEVLQLHGEILQLKQNSRLLSEETVRLKEQIVQLEKQRQPLTCDKEVAVRTGYAFANLESSPIFENYDDIIQWFNDKQIQIEPNQAAMDISGFFDEIAVQMGDNYGLLGDICEKIKRSQTKWGQFTLSLTDRSQKDTQTIMRFLKDLYDNAFITRYNHDKTNKRVHISLQTMPKIMNFFNGDWLEWYVLMKVATLLVDKKVKFSCLRGFHIYFPNEDKHEVDLFFLIKNKTPLWIECKTGEFRQFISKYSTLRNRLKLKKTNSVLLVLGMPDEKVAGLSGTFDLTVVNEHNFLKHIEELL